MLCYVKCKSFYGLNYGLYWILLFWRWSDDLNSAASSAASPAMLSNCIAQNRIDTLHTLCSITNSLVGSFGSFFAHFLGIHFGQEQKMLSIHIGMMWLTSYTFIVQIHIVRPDSYFLAKCLWLEMTNIKTGIANGYFLVSTVVEPIGSLLGANFHTENISHSPDFIKHLS